jgi:hypothetical protein
MGIYYKSVAVACSFPEKKVRIRRTNRGWEGRGGRKRRVPKAYSSQLPSWGPGKRERVPSGTLKM